MNKYLSKIDSLTSKAGGIIGITLALAVVFSGGAIGVFILHHVERENRESIQQILRSTSGALANQTKAELKHIEESVTQIAVTWTESPEFSQLMASSDPPRFQARFQDGDPTHSQVNSQAARPMILDVSIWERGSAESVFEVDPIPKRVLLGLNDLLPNVEIAQRVVTVQNSEIPYIQAAFHGRAVVVLSSPIFERDEGVLMTLPIDKGPVPQRVAAAHISLEHFLGIIRQATSTALSSGGLPSVGLVDAFGHTVPKGFVFPKSLSVLEEQAGGIFQGPDGESYYGSVNIVQPGQNRDPSQQLKTFATLSVDAMGAPTAFLHQQIMLILLFFIMLFLGVGSQLRKLFSLQDSSQQSQVVSAEGLTDLEFNLNSEQEPGVDSSQSRDEPEPFQKSSGAGAIDGGSQEADSIDSASPQSQSSETELWFVDNGTHAVGPLTSRDIACRLFAQELDFDCPCWLEGSKASHTIREAAIFGHPGDGDADLWVYKNETIHGPISPGFLRTAIGHGALSPDQMLVCQGSTVNGWKKLEDWNPDFFRENKQPDTLAASLAPPLNRLKFDPPQESED